jgi:hypothetical protein
MDFFGLGQRTKPNDLKRDDDEFDMYRKRMQLAYKFRPNPMVLRLKKIFNFKIIFFPFKNNPRRPY